jgi:hypothetical protein
MIDTTEVRNLDAEYANGLDFEDLEAIMFDGIAEAADGCTVEPDGKCPHGHESPLLVLGMI